MIFGTHFTLDNSNYVLDGGRASALRQNAFQFLLVQLERAIGGAMSASPSPPLPYPSSPLPFPPLPLEVGPLKPS